MGTTLSSRIRAPAASGTQTRGLQAPGNRGGHGEELGTVCPGDGVWGGQGAKQLRTSGGVVLSQRH